MAAMRARLTLMQMPRLLCILAFLVSGLLPATAKDAPGYLQVLSELAPQLQHLGVWTLAEGDLNGDDIPDAALVVLGWNGEDGTRDERLVVLAGQPDGSYRILSISGQFCHPRKFYNLNISKQSLFVEALSHASSAYTSSTTFQFRYEAKRDDLVLIGREYLSENLDDGSLHRISTNYLTGDVVEITRARGITESAKGRVASSAHRGLNGTTCDAFLD